MAGLADDDISNEIFPATEMTVSVIVGSSWISAWLPSMPVIRMWSRLPDSSSIISSTPGPRCTSIVGRLFMFGLARDIGLAVWFISTPVMVLLPSIRASPGYSLLIM